MSQKLMDFIVIDEDPSSTFMADTYSRMDKGSTILRADLKDSSVVGTSLGPCLVMAVVSWGVLYTLYQWLA